MNKNIKTEWTTLLRSGELPQGEGWLQRGGAFCCLGVLCEIAVKHDVIPPPIEMDGVTYYGSAKTELPDGVFDWADLPEDERWSRGLSGFEYHVQDMLIALNDTQGASFDDIADWIEANL